MRKLFSDISYNPIMQSSFFSYEQILVAPGAPEFIETEDSLFLLTEDGETLITEG